MIKSFTPTKTINIDEDTSINIDDLPTEIQAIVELYDEWRVKELETKSEFLRAQYAMSRLGAELAQKVKDHLNPPADTTEEGKEESSLDEVVDLPDPDTEETE